MHADLPVIAIVGRPNVGKSALFNRICKQRISIVEDVEGVTRDRLYAKTEIFGKGFYVIDTGGIQFENQQISEEIRRQAQIAIEEADRIIFVVDGQIGITTLDQEVAMILLRSKKKVILAVNKIDERDQESLLAPFYRLGIKEVIAVSASHGYQIAELCEVALDGYEPKQESTQQLIDPNTIQVAIVGRPNVGKSTLLNQLLGEQRSVVSDVPGTTRDAIDAKISQQGIDCTFIDTAGIRKKKSEVTTVEKFAAMRTERAIERAEVCLLMIDAAEGLTAQEKRIASDLETLGKGCVLLINKWDAVKGFRMEHCLEAIEKEVPFLRYVPKIFISAKTGRNLEKIFPAIKRVHDNLKLRITTGQLNQTMRRAIARNHPPVIQGKRLKIYYLAQVSINPPTLALFVNFAARLTESYRKYLVHKIREEWGFEGVPFQFLIREKQKQKSSNENPHLARSLEVSGLIQPGNKTLPTNEELDEQYGEELEGDFDEDLETLMENELMHPLELSTTDLSKMDPSVMDPSMMDPSEEVLQ